MAKGIKNYKSTARKMTKRNQDALKKAGKAPGGKSCSCGKKKAKRRKK